MLGWLRPIHRPQQLDIHFRPLLCHARHRPADPPKVSTFGSLLLGYNYVCFHVGEDGNVWADLLTRWTIPLNIRRVVIIPPLPMTVVDFNCPTVEVIEASQRLYVYSLPNGFVVH